MAVIASHKILSNIENKETAEELYFTRDEEEEYSKNAKEKKASIETKENQESNTLSSEREYYITASLLNLLKTSRTAENGEIDVSAATGTSRESISKETIGAYSQQEISELENNNDKAKNLDLKSLQKMHKKEISEITIRNYLNAVKLAFSFAQGLKKNKEKRKDFNIKEFIEAISKIIGNKIVKNEKWFRKHDSNKYPYTNVSELENEFDRFCAKFLYKLQNIPEEKLEQSNWAKKTAAWVEYRINLTDHFMTDSCGKVAAVMAAFICMLVSHPLPVFLGKDEYLSYAPRKPALSNSEEENNDKQYELWERYYQTKFFDTIENQQKEVFERVSLRIPEDYKKTSEEEEYLKKYYRFNALDGLPVVSKTIKTGKINTTGYNGKEKMVGKLPEIEAVSLSTVKFTSLIDIFFIKLKNIIDKPLDVSFLENLIKEILIHINEKTLETKYSVSDPIENFLRNEESRYPCTKVNDLPKEFMLFLNETVKRLNSPDKFNVIETLALIHYRVFLHHYFFREGCSRAAFALVIFSCIKLRIHLPRLLEVDKSPDKNNSFDTIERHYNRYYVKKYNVENVERDPQFSHWYFFYQSLFTDYSRLKVEDSVERVVTDTDFKDGWDITEEQTLDSGFTIYEPQIGTRRLDEIARMSKATGYDPKRLVVFTPQRILLHEGIVYIKTTFQVNVTTFKSLIDSLRDDKIVWEKIQILQEEFSETKKNFKEYVTYAFEDYFHAVRGNSELQLKIQKFSTLIQKRIKEGKCKIRVSESRELMINLITDDLLRDFYKKKIQDIVSGYFEKLSEKPTLLTRKKNSLRSAWAIVGGPASGKSSLIEEVYEQTKVGEDCCVINPDDYKPLLKTTKVKDTNAKYAALVHEESSYITDALMDKLESMIKINLAPNILLDVVTSSEPKMKIIGEGGATIHLFVVSCPVEGPEGAVARAFRRAQDGLAKDKGRYVPTKVILSGHQKESELLPDTISKFKVNLCLFDTSTRIPRVVGVMEGHNNYLNIYEPILFYNFLKKTKIYVKAAFQKQSYVEILTGDYIAKLISEYISKGITISFRYDEDEIKDPRVDKLKKEIDSLKAELKVDKESKSEDEMRQKTNKAIIEKKNKIKELKKQNVFAILSKENIICYDFDALSKIFGKEEIAKVRAQQFLNFFIINPIQKNDGLDVYSFYLYGTNGQCILRRDGATDRTIHYNPILETMCPILFKNAALPKLKEILGPTLKTILPELFKLTFPLMPKMVHALEHNPNILGELVPLVEKTKDIRGTFNDLVGDPSSIDLGDFPLSMDQPQDFEPVSSPLIFSQPSSSLSLLPPSSQKEADKPAENSKGSCLLM